MQKDAAALYVAEKAVAEADPFVRTLDEARNIGEHEFASINVHDAELRIERGKRIIGDLRLGGADGGKERRLSGVRQSHDTGIGDELEPQTNGVLLTRETGIGATGRTIGRSLEVCVTEAAVAAARQHDALACFGEICEQHLAIFLVDLSADRHLEHRVSAVGAVPILAHAGPAVLGGEVLLVAVVDERIEAIDRLGDDIAAFAAITAVRAAELYEFFPTERHAAVPAVAGADIDLGLVKKFHGGITWYDRADGSNWRATGRNQSLEWAQAKPTSVSEIGADIDLGLVKKFHGGITWYDRADGSNWRAAGRNQSLEWAQAKPTSVSRFIQTFIRVRKHAYEDKFFPPKVSCRCPLRAPYADCGHAGSRPGRTTNNPSRLTSAGGLHNNRASGKSLDGIQVAAGHDAKHRPFHCPRYRSRVSRGPNWFHGRARHTSLGDQGSCSRNRQRRVHLRAAVGA